MALSAFELCEETFGMSRDDLESIIAFLRSAESRQMSHSDVEKLVRERSYELSRKLFQAHVDSRGPGEAAAPVRGADGVERDQERIHERGLTTIFGEIRVKRFGYGAEGADSLHPLDAELNLPRERYSFELRRTAAVEVSKGAFDEAVASLGRHTGAKVGKRQVEELAGSSETSCIGKWVSGVFMLCCVTKQSGFYEIPGSRRTRVAVETLRDWLDSYRRGGFDALYPQPRRDQGQARAIPQEVADHLCTIKENNRALSVALVIEQAQRSGAVPESVNLAPATVHRLLCRHDLMGKKAYEPTSKVTQHPFSNEIEPEELFLATSYKELEVRLAHLIDMRGIGLVTGDSGSGKTCCCRKVLHALHASLYRVLYVCLSTGNVMDLYKTISWEMGLPVERSRAALFRQIRAEVTRLVSEARCRPILVIDEAHHLRPEVLEELRLLTNYNMDAENRLCLLLLGQSELRRRLSMAVHEALSQRIVVRYHLSPLTREELPAYLTHRLRCAGTELPIFEPPAQEALFQASGGLPRKVNLLAHHALLAAALARTKSVSAEHVELALPEVA